MKTIHAVCLSTILLAGSTIVQAGDYGRGGHNSSLSDLVELFRYFSDDQPAPAAPSGYEEMYHSLFAVCATVRDNAIEQLTELRQLRETNKQLQYHLEAAYRQIYAQQRNLEIAQRQNAIKAGSK
jgi:hypothetical protein